MLITPSIATPSDLKEEAFGGGLEGAERTSRETLLWNAASGSADQIINSVKSTADDRSRDVIINDAYALGGVNIHKDSIVGAQFRLNSRPNFRAIGADEAWAEKYQLAVESRFNNYAQSEDCWFDAAGRSTFTGLIRQCVASFLIHGEILMSVEWLKSQRGRRPFDTALKMISPSRLTTPDGTWDDKRLRAGIELDRYGRPVAYHIRNSHPGDISIGMDDYFTWKRVPAEKPWGRKQILHFIEPIMIDQTRGVSDLVSALKQMRMTKKYQDIVLQNAVLNASYAAAIESELPSSEVFQALGANSPDPAKVMQEALFNYMDMMRQYGENSKTLALDGVKIPHLFAGTKLTMQPAGTPGGVGTNYEQSLLRYTASALGLSYEQFSRDYTQTNYSSARASINETNKYMSGRKKATADRAATCIFALWLEEEINKGTIPLPRGKDASWFYEPGVKDALTQCTWIGASRGQIDEKKETDAAVARINAGLSTLETECARLGEDYRDVLTQRKREFDFMKANGIELPPSLVSKQTAQAETENPEEDENGGI